MNNELEALIQAQAQEIQRLNKLQRMKPGFKVFNEGNVVFVFDGKQWHDTYGDVVEGRYIRHAIQHYGYTLAYK